jgi:RNA-directed DNA polymerase
MVVSVRRSTQVNRGRQTPGIDGERATTPEARATRVDDLRQSQPRNAAPGRRVSLPRAKWEHRALGTPTRRDRVRHMAVKNALGPRFEAAFEAQRSGVRPGRGGRDALAAVSVALSSGAVGHHQDTLDAESHGAFDRLRHDVSPRRRGPRPGRELVKHRRHAGYR